MTPSKAPTHMVRSLLDEKQAAEKLSLSVRTLQQWRVRGTGPAYLKLGNAVRYDDAVMDGWLDDQIHTSTAA